MGKWYKKEQRKFPKNIANKGYHVGSWMYVVGKPATFPLCNGVTVYGLNTKVRVVCKNVGRNGKERCVSYSVTDGSLRMFLNPNELSTKPQQGESA